MDHQNRTYNAENTSRIAAINTQLAGERRNMLLSRGSALLLIRGPARLMPIMSSTVKKKAQPIQMKKGISYAPVLLRKAVYNHVSVPKTFTANCPKNTDATKPLTIPAIAAVPVVLFQNIPSIKVAKTPGLIY